MPSPLPDWRFAIARAGQGQAVVRASRAFARTGVLDFRCTVAKLRSMDDDPDLCLATYGTLAPGEVNHGQLAELPGEWSTGTVNGWLKQSGWGADLGFPGLVLDDAGPPVTVHIFRSSALPAHWDRLDTFEGDGYQRSLVTVRTESGNQKAWLYEVIAEE
ncbi:gamma-glutamylcyclotransferase family protein [Cognatiyoonia sp. IB215446]|uniref:gamma-glutamylcyclotransferase family protein n=1 Tax=Cognatiyoonia sp. IB215446 TaxID=3097355 RepID=UPI002A111F49|nr:gamma-glutamylcyclotransferase family protein [Cognatiyoonia sp. IB215446]MDX8349977.1 gamma-glutamylcyclotransferase family protein [Cognatiyoonia sp. IB215446]